VVCDQCSLAGRVRARLQVSVCSGYDMFALVNTDRQTDRQTDRYRQFAYMDSSAAAGLAS